MTDTLQLQRIKGRLFSLDRLPEDSLQVALSRKMTFYKDETQVIGDEKTVQVDDNGDWSIDLLDTDNMEPETHYIFVINERVYCKYVPVSSLDWNFNDLPNVEF